MANYNITKITVFILFISQLGLAQTKKEESTKKQPVKIGIKAGYSLGRLSSSADNIYTENYESTSGFDWGVTFEFPLTKTISVQPEINFTNRGGKRTGLQPITGNELSEQLNQFLPFIDMPLVTGTNPLYANFESESKLNYLEVPVLAKFSWGSDFRFFVEAGPYVGILLSAEQVTIGTSQFYFDSTATNPVIIPNPQGSTLPFVQLPAQSLNAETDIKDDLKTVNFGGIIGLGFGAKMGNRGELLVDARTSYSFNTIQLQETYGESHIGGVIFSLGYAHTF